MTSDQAAARLPGRQEGAGGPVAGCSRARDAAASNVEAPPEAPSRRSLTAGAARGGASSSGMVAVVRMRAPAGWTLGHASGSLAEPPACGRASQLAAAVGRCTIASS